MHHAVPRGTTLFGASRIDVEYFGASFKESILLKTVVIYLVLSASKDFLGMQYIHSKIFWTLIVQSSVIIVYLWSSTPTAPSLGLLKDVPLRTEMPEALFSCTSIRLWSDPSGLFRPALNPDYDRLRKNSSITSTWNFIKLGPGVHHQE